MIYKILGLILITPLLSIAITFVIARFDYGSWKESFCNIENVLEASIAICFLLYIIELFGFGLYFLFK